MLDFQKFIDEAMAARPVERKMLKRIRTALKAAGDPIIEAYDGEETTPVTTLRSLYETAFNLDEVYLFTKSGSWVRITMGEGWDALCDYTLDIEDALKPVNDWIEKNAD